ncbi:hypothetical protein GWI33_019346 [Rhynchophorus ferrugineus]|uniref:Uncharacterized protein n=1 Tax=Rhynchophorus ferrugineus TaxID=354439 RepID=A0A834HRW3_RHYFE|nr:hypothetical protein GWI33_019346 [Rhynchophorus ferrugineus]
MICSHTFAARDNFSVASVFRKKAGLQARLKSRASLKSTKSSKNAAKTSDQQEEEHIRHLEAQIAIVQNQVSQLINSKMSTDGTGNDMIDTRKSDADASIDSEGEFKPNRWITDTSNNDQTPTTQSNHIPAPTPAFTKKKTRVPLIILHDKIAYSQLIRILTLQGIQFGSTQTKPERVAFFPPIPDNYRMMINVLNDRMAITPSACWRKDIPGQFSRPLLQAT